MQFFFQLLSNFFFLLILLLSFIFCLYFDMVVFLLRFILNQVLSLITWGATKDQEVDFFCWWSNRLIHYLNFGSSCTRIHFHWPLRFLVTTKIGMLGGTLWMNWSSDSNDERSFTSQCICALVRLLRLRWINKQRIMIRNK